MQGNVTVKRIVGANSYELSPNFSLDTHTHDAYELFFVDSGSISFYYDGSEPFVLHGGEMLLHKPGIPHGTVCDGKHSGTFFNVLFKSKSECIDALAGSPMKITDELYPLVRAIVSEAERCYYLSVEPLKRKKDAPLGAEQLVMKYLEILFIRLLRGDGSRSEPKSRSRENLKLPADDIYRYLADAVYRRLTLDDICEHFHFGRTHISVGFKKKFGISVMDCYIDMKIAEAKRMLREETLSVGEISEKLCFDSPEYFARCFKKRVGYTPRVYRRLLIGGKIAKI